MTSTNGDDPPPEQVILGPCAPTETTTEHNRVSGDEREPDSTSEPS